MANRSEVTQGLSAVSMFAGAFIAYTLAFWVPDGTVKAVGALLVPVFVRGGIGTLNGRTTRGLFVGLVTAAAVLAGLAAFMYLTLELPATR